MEEPGPAGADACGHSPVDELPKGFESPGPSFGQRGHEAVREVVCFLVPEGPLVDGVQVRTGLPLDEVENLFDLLPLRPAHLEVAALGLLALDGHEQLLEVAEPEALRAVALDDLEEHRG